MDKIQKYMLVKNGVVVAFYSSEVHDEIPNEAIEITDELWQYLLSLGQAKLKNKKKRSGFMTDDFEQNIIEPTDEEKKEKELQELYDYLKQHDYIAVKIATGVSTIEDYADIIAKQEEVRARIAELEGE